MTDQEQRPLKWKERWSDEHSKTVLRKVTIADRRLCIYLPYRPSRLKFVFHTQELRSIVGIPFVLYAVQQHSKRSTTGVARFW